MDTRAWTSFTSVFINCPFTSDYAPLFEAIVFTVLACGFRPRSALEKGDDGEVRMDKIIRLIKASPYSIHDLSAVELDSVNRLPRFNMPFELGLTLGLRAAGCEHACHMVLILERHQYTSQKCLSDIAGQDLQAHGGDVSQVILQVRNWLRIETGRELPGPRHIGSALQNFRAALPRSCESVGVSVDDVPFPERLAMQLQFLKEANADLWLR
jgi:hypothetical protein